MTFLVGLRFFPWLSTRLGVLLTVVPLMCADLPEALTPVACDSFKLKALEGKLIAQGQLLAAQQAQLAALQASLEQQVAALAQQKTVLDGMLSASARNINAAETPPVSSIPRLRHSIETESSGLPPATSEVATAAFPRAPLPETRGSDRIASNIVKQPSQEQRYIREITHWYDKYSLRGYVQIRHNGLQDSNDEYTCEQCDKSIGPDNNFFLRRARLVLSGNVSERIYIYLQPDFASSSGSTQNLAQLRDAYFDLSFDKKKEHRIRSGLSKIPFGFEAIQSSQNRLDFDRSDAINSSFANERDIGIFYYWAPAHLRARFNELVTQGLKGSGDYGVFGAGVFNGQILNNAEANANLHYVARYTYPFKLRNGQFIEASVQGFTGKYTVTNTSDTTRGRPGFKYDDRRIAASLIIYPQPFGFQAEYNWGIGPQYVPSMKYIDQRALNGGYALVSYMRRFRSDLLVTPYFRFQYYDGGKKQELDARRYLIREGDLGVEMQFGKYLELTPQYQYGVRTFEDSSKPNNRQKGGLLRLQLQFNY